MDKTGRVNNLKEMILAFENKDKRNWLREKKSFVQILQHTFLCVALVTFFKYKGECLLNTFKKR